MILKPSLPPPPGPINPTPKYHISGDDAREIPVSFCYMRRDSIQNQTLWFCDRQCAALGSKVYAYHIAERYIKTMESGGSLPDSPFKELRLHVVIS